MANAYRHLTDRVLTTPGLAEVALWAPLSVFTTVAAFNPAQAASDGSDVVVAANHVFQANQGFIKLLGAQGKQILNFNSVGEVGNLKVDPKFELYMPGTDAKNLEYIKNFANQPGIMLVKDITQSQSTPVYYQLGDPDVYVWLNNFEGTTGPATGGTKGLKLTFSYTGEAVWHYRGTITLKP